MPDALHKARQAAYEALRESGMPAIPASALAGAMHMGEHVIDLVVDEYRERACDPKPWAAFHEAMVDSLPRIRWIARLHHRRMARRYKALIVAGKRVACGA